MLTHVSFFVRNQRTSGLSADITKATRLTQFGSRAAGD
jgi:hypothetical protein